MSDTRLEAVMFRYSIYPALPTIPSKIGLYVRACGSVINRSWVQSRPGKTKFECKTLARGTPLCSPHYVIALKRKIVVFTK